MVIPEQIIDGVTVFSPKGKLLSTVDYEEFRNRIHKLKVPPIRGVAHDLMLGLVCGHEVLMTGQDYQMTGRD